MAVARDVYLTYVSLNDEKVGDTVQVKTKIKHYPNGNVQAYVYNEPYSKGYHNGKKGIHDSVELPKTLEEIEQDKRHSAYMNLVRTRTKIKDLVLCNDFDMFWTLTFAENRGDDADCFDRLSKWLRTMRDKNGKFRYIIIPERHKDGSIHFHGVTGGFKGHIVDSGVKQRGRTVYNCPTWKYGFTTITRIGNVEKTASYVTKYVTKSLSQEVVGKGKKKYWSSRGLREPVIEHLEVVPFDENNIPDWQNDTLRIYKFTQEDYNKKFKAILD